jgi:hypothetical protein
VFQRFFPLAAAQLESLCIPHYPPYERGRTSGTQGTPTPFGCPNSLAIIRKKFSPPGIPDIVYLRLWPSVQVRNYVHVTLELGAGVPEPDPELRHILPEPELENSGRQNYEKLFNISTNIWH